MYNTMTTRTRIKAQLFPPLILVEVTTVQGGDAGTLPPSSRGPGLAKCPRVVLTEGKAVGG